MTHSLIAVAGITVHSENDDIVILVDTGTELIEVIRERGRLNTAYSGTMDHSVTSLGIQDAIEQREEWAPPAKQTRIKYE